MPRPERRKVILGALGLLGLGPLGRGQASSGPLRPTPSQIEGPYYPPEAMRRRRFPRDLDHDLSRVGDTLAQGTVIGLYGQVVGLDGRPLAGARIEIWQTCHRGRYLHVGDDFGSEIPVDGGFAYYGATDTDAEGRYGFLTVMPRRYPSGGQREWWRPPHVHFKVTSGGRARLTTQIYFDDPTDPDNHWKHRAIQAIDRLIARIEESRRHELVCELADPVAEDLAALQDAGLPAPDVRETRSPRAGVFNVVVDLT